jgi:hypothetical protein
MKDIAAAALHQIEASVASGIWEAHTTKYTNDTKISIERFRVFCVFRGENTNRRKRSS